MKSQPAHKSARLLVFLGLILGPGFFASTAFALPPANDNVSAAINLFEVNFSTFAPNYRSNHTTDTTVATLESGEPSDCVGGISKSVWYKYASTAAMILTADTFGSDFDTVLTVWTSTGINVNMGGINSSVDCNDQFNGNQSKIQNVSLSRGVTYFFQISSYYSNPGGSLVFSATFTPTTQDLIPPLAVIQQPPPGNPTLTTLYSVSGTASDSVAVNRVSVKLSTGGVGDGSGSGSSHFNFYDWKWDAYANCSTCASDAYLYSGVNSTSTVWDKYLPTLADGVSYFIRATVFDSNNNSSTTLAAFTFSAPVVIHDDFLSPIVIQSTRADTIFYMSTFTTTSAAYPLQMFPSCNYASGNRDVWYKYVSTKTSGVQVNTNGSNFNTILAVWTSTGGVTPIPASTVTNVSAGPELACNHPYSPNASVTFQISSGAIYFIQAMSEWGSGGSLNLQLSELEGDTAFPDAIANLSAVPDITPGSVRLQWTSVADDGYIIGTAAEYDIRYSTTGPITDQAVYFSTGIPVTSSPTYAAVPAPFSPSLQQNLYLYSLPQKTTVWFSIRTRDEAFNWSSLSNSPAVYVPGTIASATNNTLISFSTITALPYSDESLVNLVTPPPLLMAGDMFPTCRSIPPTTARALWYKYVSTMSGTNIVANTFNSNTDTVLQVWKDTGTLTGDLAGMPNKSQLVAEICNDDASGTQSKVNFTLSLNATYFIEAVFLYSGTLRFQMGPAESVKPGAITSLAAAAGSQNGEVNLSWKEPANDGYDSASGPVLSYSIRYSSNSQINTSNFNSSGSVRDIEASPVYQIAPSPGSPGSIKTYTVRNLNPGTTYWFSVRSQDSAGNLSDLSNSPYAPAKAPAVLASDGQGSAQIRDLSGNNVLTSVPVSSQVTLNIRFTVAASSITGGGKISVKFPDYWTPPTVFTPTDAGYVSVSTISTSIQQSNMLSVSIGTDSQNSGSVIVTVSSQGRLNPGDVINIHYKNGYSQYNKQNGVSFLVKAQGSDAGVLSPIPTQPTINVVAGVPTQVGFSDWNFLTLGSGQASPPLYVEPKDASWQQAVAHKNLNLRVFTLYWDSSNYTYSHDTQAVLSESNSNFTSTLSSSTVPTAAFMGAQWYPSLQNVGANATYYNLIIGQNTSQKTLYYKTTRLGDTVLWIEYNSDFSTTPVVPNQTFSRWFKIRSGSIGFQNFIISPPSISPNSDGSDDFANINFQPTDSDMNWRVRIGTDPVLSSLSSINNLNTGFLGGGAAGAPGAAATGVSVTTISAFMDWWGYGQPQGVAWYGNDFRGDVVPDGAYIVRLEDTGGSTVSIRTVTVDSDYMAVKVDRGSNIISTGAWVNVSGSGVSASGAQFWINRSKQVPSDGTGIAKIWGLKTGVTYNVSVNYYEPSTQRNYSESKQGTVGSTVTFSFGDPAEIRIHANIPQGSQAQYDQWGGVSVGDANSGFPVGFGSLRIPNGSLESDSGWSPTGFASSWTVVNVSNSGNYRIRAEVWGFTPYETTLAVTAGTRYDIQINLVKKPKIFGYVVLPSSSVISSYGTWVSVEGRKSGQNYPSAWGGAWFQGPAYGGGVIKTTGVFNLDVDTGTTYELKASAQGVGAVKLSNVVVSSSDFGILQVDDTGTVEGGNKVAGGVTLAFSTTVAQGVTGYITVDGNSTSQGPQGTKFTLYVNVFSPTNYSYANTQVDVYSHGVSTVSSFQIRGLDDGAYQVNTWLDGFEVFPPGPKTVQVVNGAGNINLTLKKFGGSLIVRFSTGAADVSNPPYKNVTLDVNGPAISSRTASIFGNAGFRQFGSSAEITVANLGTGFYSLSSSYNGRYLTKKVNVINGSTATIDFNFSGQVYTVMGTVKVQAFTFGVTASSSSGIRIENSSDIVNRSKIGYESIFIGTSSLQLPIARIEAYPKDASNFGQGIANFVDVGGPGNVGGAGGFSGVTFNFGQIRYGVIDSSGNYHIDNLQPGVYIFRHPVNLDPQANYYSNAVGGSFESNGADIANEQKTVLIKNTGEIQVLDPPGGNLEFTYGAGSNVTGRILLPSDASSDTRFLTLMVQNERREIVSWQSIYLNGASANYSLSNLGNGDYTLIVKDERKGNENNPNSYVAGTVPGFDSNYEKYVAKPLNISMKGSNLSGQDVQLQRASFAEGKLAVVRISSTGIKTTELITSNNKSLLPSNFRVEAVLETVGGEYRTADQVCNAGPCSLRIDADTGKFRISRIFPDTEFKVSFSQRNDVGSEIYGSQLLGQGKLNLVSVEKTGLTVGAGQVLDMGTVELQMGLSLTGHVQGLQLNGSIVSASNVRIQAKPSASFGGEQNTITAFSDSKGSFTLSGFSSDLRYYDITFAARSHEDNFIELSAVSGMETRYAQKVKRNLDVRITTQTVDVVLLLGRGTISGTVTTSDGGALKDPFGQVTGFPVAEVIVNKQGDIPTSNPLGDIIAQTGVDGSFSVDRLAPGAYDLYAMSLGYAVKKISTTVVSGTSFTVTNVGNVQLATGLELSGEIKKPDGSHPTENDVETLAAATQDFGELTIASLQKNSQTRTIDGYTLAGLKSGVTYFLLMFNREGDSVVPPEKYPANGDGVAITTTTQNFNLTFANSKPEVFMKGKKTGTKVSGIDQYRFEFNSTQALRNKTTQEKSDDYWKNAVSISGGIGGGSTNISADPGETNPLSPDRKKITVLYVPPSAATTKVRFRYTGYTNNLQPGTTSNFLADFTFDFYLGLDGQNVARINMMQGGKLTLEGDESQVLIPAGAFKKANGSDLEVSSNVTMGVQKAQDVATATSSVSGAPAFMMPDDQLDENLPSALAMAMKAMRGIRKVEVAQDGKVRAAPGLRGAAALATDVTGGNVLSAFYDLFLPAGVRRQLAKNATVTLSYSSSSADPNLMNVYFYNDTSSTMTSTDGTNVPPGSYGKESGSRVLNTDNNTISVSVDHFTVYVVVNSTESVLAGAVSVVAGGTSAAFNNSGINQVTLTLGTTFTYTGLTVSGGASESHSFTLISTGTSSSGILVNVQSILQQLSVAVGQDSLVDVSDPRDGLKDITVRVVSIHPSSAVVNISGLSGLTLPSTVDYAGTELEIFNFPNPFNAGIRGFLFAGTKTVGQATLRAEGSTAFRYALPSNLGAGPVRVTMEIYDVAGDLVKRLDFASQTTGKYHYGDWDGKNEDGQTVASGVYIGRLSIEGSNRTKTFKMAVIK